MKKSELKNILKPLIKECIKEVIFEEGVLSGIITEVAHGVSGLRTESFEPPALPVDPPLRRIQHNAFSEQPTSKLQEHKKKLMEAIGGKTFNNTNLFEGTTPTLGETSPIQQSSPVSGMDPTDKGVDISNLFGAVGRNWTAHMNDVKAKEGK